MSLLGKLILATLFWARMCAIVQAGEQPSVAKTQTGTFQVKLSQGSLSLEATQAPLMLIFQEIGKQAKIAVDSNIGAEEKVTIHLERVPLEEGIKRLAKNVTVFYTENPRDKSRRISRVVVLTEGSGVSGQAKAISQPVKVNKPAPQPEPFQFEFTRQKP